jgi:hypothetical protein
MARNRNAQRADLAAQLRYQPQSLALLELLQQAKGQFETGSEAAGAAATGVARSAKKAIAPTRQDFQASRQATLARNEVAAGNVAELGPAATPYKASFETEAALADQLSRSRQRDTVTELRGRAVDARAGAAQEQRQLRSEYAGQVGDIGRQLQQVASQQGAYGSSVYQDLIDAAADRKTDRLGLLLEGKRYEETARHNRATEGISQQRADQDAIDAARRARGRRWLPSSQANRVFDQIEEAQKVIEELETYDFGSGEIRRMLILGEGIPDTRDPRTGEILPGMPVPKLPKDLVNAAYDLYVLGGLSQANVEALRRRGVRPLRRYERAPARDEPSVEEVVERAKRTGGAVKRTGRALQGVGG